MAEIKRKRDAQHTLHLWERGEAWQAPPDTQPRRGSQLETRRAHAEAPAVDKRLEMRGLSRFPVRARHPLATVSCRPPHSAPQHMESSVQQHGESAPEREREGDSQITLDDGAHARWRCVPSITRVRQARVAEKAERSLPFHSSFFFFSLSFKRRKPKRKKGESEGKQHGSTPGKRQPSKAGSSQDGRRTRSTRRAWRHERSLENPRDSPPSRMRGDPSGERPP